MGKEKNNINIVIVTGFSGAGKSRALTALEDLGYYCVDNIPPDLILQFVEITKERSPEIENVAIAIDSRGGRMFKGLLANLHKLREAGYNYKMLFLEASPGTISRRYKETRRRHPLITDELNTVEKAVLYENQLLTPLYESADYKINTDYISSAQLRERIKGLFTNNPKQGFTITLLSFGFKHGPAIEADILFDIRCLPNPYYIDELREKTGLENEVREYVLSMTQTGEFIKKLKDLTDFLLPLYVTEGKSHLTMAFGCTGGKHRSVTFAEYFKNYYSKNGYHVTVMHRDIDVK